MHDELKRRIEVHEFVTQKPNGDRATTTVPSSRFAVMLCRMPHYPDDPVELRSFDTFDSFHCGVRDKKPIEKQALEYAHQVNRALGEWEHIKFRKFVEEKVTTTIWKEIE